MYSLCNILLQYTCQIYWCYETVSHITPCTIFLFNIHVRYTDIMQCITCHSMCNILDEYTCLVYWCSETVSHETPCTIFLFNIHVRYTDIMKWITCHYMCNILVQYMCQIYWCYETVSHVMPCTIFIGDVSRSHKTALRVTMLYDNHVPCNENIVTANNVCLSCKINSCSLPH